MATTQDQTDKNPSSQKYADSSAPEQRVDTDLGTAGSSRKDQLRQMATDFKSKVMNAHDEFMGNLAGNGKPPLDMRNDTKRNADNAANAPTNGSQQFGTPQGAVQTTDSAPAGLPDGGSPDPYAIQPGAQASGALSGTVGMEKDKADQAVSDLDSQSRMTNSEEIRRQQEANKSAEDANLAKKAYETHLSKETNNIDAQVTVEAQRFQNKIDQINSDADLAMKNEMGRIQGAVQAAQDFQFKDFWASRSAMGSVMGIMAAALGGAANGVAGTPGQPTALDRVISQDLEVQKLKYGQLRDNVSAERSLFQDLVQQTGSVRAAETAFHGAVMSKFDAMMKQTASSMGAEAANSNYLVASAAAKQISSDKMNSYAQQRLETLKTEAGLKVNIALSSQRLAATMLSKVGAGQIDQLRGQGVLGGDFQKGEAVKLNQTMSQAKRALGLLDEVIKNPNILQDQARRGEIQSAVSNIMNQGRTSKIAQESIDVGSKGHFYSSLLNKLNPGDTRKLQDLRAQVVNMINDQTAGKGGIMAPVLPNGERNPFYSEARHGDQFRKFVQSKGGNRVAPSGGKAEAADAVDDGGTEEE